MPGGGTWGKPGPGGAYWRQSALTGQGFFAKMVRRMWNGADGEDGDGDGKDGDDGRIDKEEIYHFPRVGLIRRIHGSGVSL